MDLRPLVVGVDSKPGTASAVAWAAAECQLRGVDLVLLHVIDDTDLLATSGQPSPTQRREEAERTIASHVQSLRQSHPSLPVRQKLTPDRPARALVEASFGAALVVLGTNGAAGIARSILGAVGHRVATHAHSPVVIVTESAAAGHRRPDGPIVVGLATSVAGRLGLHLALAEAELRGCRIIAVAAGAGATDALILEAKLAERSPDIELLVTDDDPAEALLGSAQTASLVVIGCHHESETWSTRLGPIATNVLANAPCAVLLAGQSQ